MGLFESAVLRIFLLLSGIVSMLIFSWRLKRRNYFWLRLVAFVVLYTGIDYASNIIIMGFEKSSLDENLKIFLHCLFNVLTFSGLTGFMCLLYKENFLTMLFCAISGKCTMHIAEYVSKILFFLTVKNTYLSIAVYIVIYLFIYFVFARRINGEEFIFINNLKIVLFALIVLIASDVLLLAFSDLRMDALINVYIFALITIICIMILFLQYNLLAESRHKSEAIVISRLREKEREQYEISKEAINLIGIRQHDIKSMLQSRIGLNGNELKDLVNSIDEYELPYKTGNGTLDVIFMEKQMVCNSKKIKLEVSVDGKLLGFLNEMDIYSLFLNALNNAIEATEKIEDPEQREIRLKSFTRGDLLIIQIRNPYTELVRSVSSGTGFTTTKPDKNNHGFGLRSMKMITEKYGGEMHIKAENNTFCLAFAFMMQDKKTK